MNPEAQLLADALKEARKASNEARDVLSPVAHSGSHVTLNAGGVALWLAVTCCAVVMAVTVVGSIFVAIALSDLNRQTQELRYKDDLLQAYISTGTPPEEKK